MNVVVTGGGTIAPIDDVRLIANVSSGRFAASISRGFAGSWGLGLAHPCAIVPGSAAGVSPVARWTRADPSAEMDRLARLRRRWLDVRDRLHLVPLKEGTVSDYAATLKGVLCARVDRRGHPGDGGFRLRARAVCWEGRLRRGIDGCAMPAHAQGDPFGPRLGAFGLPGRFQAAIAQPAPRS